MISRDDSDPGLRYMLPIKSSLAAEGPAIAFSFGPQGGLEWLGRYEINTSKLKDSITVKTSKRKKARSVIAKLLENGDIPAQEAYTALEAIGVGRRTVEKARTEMKIRAYRSGGCWYWSLPRLTERGQDD